LPSTTFAALGVSDAVCASLARGGITEPFPIQARVMSDALQGRDVLVQSPTGSGKTLAFGIPLVERLAADAPPHSALILVPTRELAAQVARELAGIARVRGLRVARAYGGASLREQVKYVAKAQVIVATPGRLADLAGRGAVRLERVRVLVLDEADRMLDMGFQPQVDDIVRRIPADRQTMFFSATLGERVLGIARAYTRDAQRHADTTRPQETGPIEHRFLPVPGDRVAALVDLLTDEADRSLVFVRTKHGADRLADKLKRAGIRAGVMHGDKTQAARERALGAFATGKVRTLVATDVAARGIDIDDVTHVINFDPPDDADAYTHRVGRTGRAGRPGTGITLVAADHGRQLTPIVQELLLVDEYTAGGLELDTRRAAPAARRQHRGPQHRQGVQRPRGATRNGARRRPRAGREG
jgi:superfamily II DNA/RNA helicase